MPLHMISAVHTLPSLDKLTMNLSRSREFTYSKFMRKNLLISLAAVCVIKKNPMDVMSDNLPLKCHQQETVGYLPGTCVRITPPPPNLNPSTIRLRRKDRKLKPKSPNPNAQESPRLLSEPCSEGLKRQYVVVSSPPLTGL